jgi:hypothetical protein
MRISPHAADSLRCGDSAESRGSIFKSGGCNPAVSARVKEATEGPPLQNPPLRVAVGVPITPDMSLMR